VLDAVAAARIIDHISRARGEPNRTSTMPQRPGPPDGILAVRGKTELEPLSDARIALIAKGQVQATEFLVDFLVDAPAPPRSSCRSGGSVVAPASSGWPASTTPAAALCA
jgi:hypothetical protein